MKIKLLDTAFRLFGYSPYESVNPSPHRSRVPGSAPTDTKKELTPHTRNEMVRRSRYLHKNSGFHREIVGDMAIYATGDGIRPQAQSSDPAWNKAAQAYFSNWCAMPEVTRRFSFEECQSLVCRGMDVDGEYFVVKVRADDGTACIQLAEAHRIGDKFGSTETLDGIIYDSYGSPTFYRFIEDGGTTIDIPASAVLHIYEPESVSAVRSAPTMQHSINHLLDEMELIALEKAAVKDNAGISRVVKTESGTLDESSDYKFSTGTGGEGDLATPSDPQAIQKIIGGRVVALKPGESLDTHQPNRPSPVFTGFLEHLKRDSSAGILPYEFVLDSSKIGGAGVRLVVAKADRRFSYRQLTLIQRFLRPVWGWVIGDAIDRGELPAIENWNKVNWVTPRRITVDAGREAQQNRADIEMGIKTLDDHYKELGADFDEELEIRAQNARAILEKAEQYKVPPEMLYRPYGDITKDEFSPLYPSKLTDNPR